MNQEPQSATRKEQIYSLVLVIAGLAAWYAAFREKPWGDLRHDHILEAMLFVSVAIFADHFPIHLTRGVKVSLTNLPIYLGTVLLPAPLAVLVAGGSILIAEMRAQKERGLLARDIATSTGQWMIAAYVSGWLFRMDPSWLPEGLARLFSLSAGALSFLTLDILFFAVSTAFIFQQPFLHTLRSVQRESLVVEGIQYLLAILGTLAVLENHWLLVFLVIPALAIYILFKNTKEVKEDTLHLLEHMADIIDLRDVYTGGHSKRVAQLVEKILNGMNIFGQEADIITTAARLHDIGKIGIPDSILKKPGKLLPEEMAVMQTHSEKGAELISKYKDFARGAQMIRHHHERWDGKGYPAGLKAHDIPFGARVIAVADSFDAMTSDRLYRNALTTRQALQILHDGQGKQWDASIVSAFLALMAEQSPDNLVLSVTDHEPEIVQVFSQKALP